MSGEEETYAEAGKVYAAETAGRLEPEDRSSLAISTVLYVLRTMSDPAEIGELVARHKWLICDCMAVVMVQRHREEAKEQGSEFP